MKRVTYSLTTSLDGYTTDPTGGLDWSVPDQEVFDLATEEVRGLDVHLLGRHLYETMLYWQDPPSEPEEGFDTSTFTTLWQGLPKVVFSRTLTQVRGKARLATATLAEEIEHLRAGPGTGDIGIGGPSLAAQAAAAGLIDEYRIRVAPVLLGGGTRFFAHDCRRSDLDLLESRTLGPGVLHLRYRVRR